jgi:hypothetical protein
MRPAGSYATGERCMVEPLRPPERPLKKKGRVWTWEPRTLGQGWEWCRIYHRDSYSPTGATHRTFGPKARLDPHTASVPPAECPEGRSVLYVARDLMTAVGEVFGDTPSDAGVCPNMRIALIEPTKPITLLDLVSPGTAMAIGAYPSLLTGAYPYAQTQEWARAIYEDQPARKHVTGIQYTAAHAGADSLALWDTDNDVQVVVSPAGAMQDFALRERAMWSRVLTAGNDLSITLTPLAPDDCDRCPS